MNLEEALKLIFSEARTTGDGLIVTVRNGEDPGPERMQQLISALGVLFQALEGQTELNRKLTAALFTLGSDVPLTISSLMTKMLPNWRREFVGVEVFEMLMGVQSIFEGRWMELDTAETVH